MLIAILCFSALFSSCQQDEEILSIATGNEEIVIKMAVGSSVSSFSNVSRSAPDPDKQAISNNQTIKGGDTVDVENISGVNIIMFAENSYGQPINGSWSISCLQTDRELSYEINGIVSDIQFVCPFTQSGNGSATSLIVNSLGLYKAVFMAKTGEEKSFFIRHTGIPGSLGDESDNDYSFRLDKSTYRQDDSELDGFTLYIKGQSSDFPDIDEGYMNNPQLSSNWYGTVFSGTQARTFKSSVCKFSPGYVCLSFFGDNFENENFEGTNYYLVSFFSKSIGTGGTYLFPSVKKSSWEIAEGGAISFYGI